MPGWRINQWIYAHPRHGMFFVSENAVGDVHAQRVHGESSPFQIEWIGGDAARFENVPAAMIACQERIHELDRAAPAASASAA
jgi:hypothetical protein